jgi:ZIP family zinc transporter
LGAVLVGFFTTILPFSLSFAAGAMIFVAVKELIPEAEKEDGYLSSVGCISGFTLMMILDVALS